MSTHRRAWKQRAGVVVALVAGALLAVPATPAQAARITQSDGSVTIDAGRPGKAVNVKVNFEADENSAKISITGLPDGVSCGGCGDITPGLLGREATATLTLTAAGNAPAANGTRATIRVEGSRGTDSAPLSVTVKAAPPPPPPQVQTVKSVSGKVTIEANGKPVPNATVMLLDSQQRRHQTSSDGDGNFRFTGSSQDPIAPGRLELGAGKDGVTNSKAITANAGQSLSGQRISLDIKVEVTPSATPSATEEPVPTEEPTEETAEESAEATPGQQAANANEEGGFGSILIFLLGGLLVAAGVGTIVLLWMRRKNDDDDEGTPVGAAAGAVPAAHGAYRGADDQTRVVNRVGAGPDPTMVGGAALSDAPTMMHRPVVDDVPPDPYGAPPPSYGPNGQQDWAGNGYRDEAPGGYGAGGYGNAPASGGGYDAGGYGNAPSSGGGYGNAPSSGGGYGNAPSSGGGYGAPAGAAGAAGYPPAPGGGAGYGERYDEPTGRYTGDGTQSYTPAADPYPTSTYQPPADQGHGYGEEPQQYGRAPEPPGGYGGGGYGAPAGGGYDAGQQGGYDGYDQRGGYGSGDYDQPAGGGHGQQGGYGQEPPQQRGGGYDNNGYDQGGGYYADPAQAGPAQAGRGRPDGPGQERGGRRLDWLDD